MTIYEARSFPAREHEWLEIENDAKAVMANIEAEPKQMQDCLKG